MKRCHMMTHLQHPSPCPSSLSVFTISFTFGGLITIAGDSLFSLVRGGWGSGGGVAFSIYSANASVDTGRGLRVEGTGEVGTGLGRV